MSHKDGDWGRATIEPYESVVFDADRARQGRPAWKGEYCGYYLDSEVQPLNAPQSEVN